MSYPLRIRTVSACGTGGDSDLLGEIIDVDATVTGELTIRGVTREVVLDVEYGGRTKDPWGNERAGFTAKTALEAGEVFAQLAADDAVAKKIPK